jgi:hypothetical protein
MGVACRVSWTTPTLHKAACLSASKQPSVIRAAQDPLPVWQLSVRCHTPLRWSTVWAPALDILGCDVTAPQVWLSQARLQVRCVLAQTVRGLIWEQQLRP